MLADGGLQPSLDGYWMCGVPTVTAYTDPSQLSLFETEYSVSGEIPWMRAGIDVLTENVDGGGYALR